MALAAGSAYFCLRRGWLALALVWGALFAFQILARLDRDGPWTWGLTPAQLIAPFWTAWALGRYVRGKSRQTA